MRLTKIALLTASMAFAVPAVWADSSAQRAERRYISEGNKLYREKRFSEAETQYKKALEANASSATATYNLAASLLRQATTGESGKKLIDEAGQLLTDVMTNADDVTLAQHAAYNLGNIAYNSQQWDKSIEYYKEALRRNPDDDKARENLRLAQLKKQQNQDQDQNKDQDKNKEQDKDKDQQKDKQQEQQNPQKQNPDNQQKQQPQQPQGGISPENAEKILKAMENEEAATRRRVQNAEKKKGVATKRIVGKPW